MKLRLTPSVINEDRSTEDSTISEARNKLFKVKHIENRNLYDDENTRGEHLVLTVGINPKNNDVVTATITSLEDAERNPTKQNKVRQVLIMPLPENKIRNFSQLEKFAFLFFRQKRNNKLLSYGIILNERKEQ